MKCKVSHSIQDQKPLETTLTKEAGVSINKEQLRQLIKEVLTEVNLYSKSAEELLMLTAAVESELGYYIEQVGTTKGGKGIFQMEIPTCQDIYNNFLRFKDEEFQRQVSVYDSNGDLDTELKGNLPFQIVRARLQYFRHSEPLPHHEDVLAMAKYHKKYYNTVKGKSEVSKSIEKYERLVLAA